MVTPKEKMTEAQLAYEAKRAAKAGKSLDKHLAEKARLAAAAAREAELAKPKPAAKPGFFSRLLDRAHKPL
jgi:hypothetical protein